MMRTSATATNFNKDRATLQIPWEHIEPTSEPNRIFLGKNSIELLFGYNGSWNGKL